MTSQTDFRTEAADLAGRARRELDALRDLLDRYTVLVENYRDDMPGDIDGRSYWYGFRAGSRSALAMAITDLREAIA